MNHFLGTYLAAIALALVGALLAFEARIDLANTENKLAAANRYIEEMQRTTKGYVRPAYRCKKRELVTITPWGVK